MDLRIGSLPLTLLPTVPGHFQIPMMMMAIMEAHLQMMTIVVKCRRSMTIVLRIQNSYCKDYCEKGPRENGLSPGVSTKHRCLTYKQEFRQPKQELRQCKQELRRLSSHCNQELK